MPTNASSCAVATPALEDDDDERLLGADAPGADGHSVARLCVDLRHESFWTLVDPECVEEPQIAGKRRPVAACHTATCEVFGAVAEDRRRLADACLELVDVDRPDEPIVPKITERDQEHGRELGLREKKPKSKPGRSGEPMPGGRSTSGRRRRSSGHAVSKMERTAALPQRDVGRGRHARCARSSRTASPARAGMIALTPTPRGTRRRSSASALRPRGTRRRSRSATRARAHRPQHVARDREPSAVNLTTRRSRRRPRSRGGRCPSPTQATALRPVGSRASMNG